MGPQMEAIVGSYGSPDLDSASPSPGSPLTAELHILGLSVTFCKRREGRLFQTGVPVLQWKGLLGFR